MPVRTIATELTLGGEKEFNDQMKAVNSNLKTLRSDMAAVSSEFRKNENSTAALRAKQKILQDQYKQQQEVVNALMKRLEHVKEVYGEDSAEADKLRQQLNAATVAMNKAKDAAEDNGKQLTKHILLLDRTKNAYGNLGKAASAMASGSTLAFSAIAKAAAGLTTAGVAAVGGMTAVGVAALETLTDFATDAATRSKTAYDKANELAEKAREEALKGNEEAAMEYLRQADELIATIDADYLRLGNSLDVLSKSSTAAKDAMGKILLPALQDLSDEGAALLQNFAAEMNAAAGDTEKMGQIMAEYLQAGIELLREKIPEFGAIAVDLLEGLGAGFDENLPAMLDDILAIVDYILQTIEEHADELGGAAAALISTLLGFLIDHAPDLLGAGGELIGAIVQGIANNLPTLLAKIPELVGSLLDTLVSNAPQLAAGGLELIGQILAGIAQALPDLLSEIISLPGKLFQAFTDANIDWSSIGSNIVAGISQGFAQMWNEFVANVTGAFDNLVNSVSGFLGIASPSKLFRDRIGKNMAAGVDVGFETEMQNVSRDMQRSLDDAMPDPGPLSFNSSVSGGGSVDGSGGSVTNMGGFTIIINGYNVQNDEELAEKIGYALQAMLDRKGA